MEGFLHYEFGGLIFRGVCTWRGLFSEFYGIIHSKYFPDSDWLKAHIYFTITSY